MESEHSPPSASLTKCCDCNCSSSVMKRSLSGTCLRSVKRKYEAFEEEIRFTIPGLDVPQIARVEIGDECMALRDTVSSQQHTIQNLISELEEERNASSSAANEAMSMILRLQRDKAEIQMEAKQFKRFAEEKMAHDQLETSSLEDLLYKREEVIQALVCEVQAYKHRLMSYGLTEAEISGFLGMNMNSGMVENLEGEFPYGMYPPLKCYSGEFHAYQDGDDETSDIEKYAFMETPCSTEQLKDLEGRINQMENSPMATQLDSAFIGVNSMLEKVIVGLPPRVPRHLRETDNPNSPSAMGTEMGPECAGGSPKFVDNFKETEVSSTEQNSGSRKANDTTKIEDDSGDRIYTIDSVHPGTSSNAFMDLKTSVRVGGDEYMTTPRESPNQSDGRDHEIQKLYARLHALEADRESMRQAIISIGTEKAQMVLLKEIAQNVSKEISPARNMPLQKQSVVGMFSFISIFKWIIPLIFWRRKARRCKYMFGLSYNNVGLLLLLDRGPHVGALRCIFSTNKKPI